MGEKNKQYLVLARKYRPQTFAELKGQDALVQTLSNAIQTNRIHHAYVLTGIRGVGKTTTARIIAKALNCENGPAVEWKEDDAAATAISNGSHIDVLEFDAASNRGVEEVQSLFEGVNYAPVQGRKKVYIIDEVHMLSKHAFNALLKTLEEPPEHIVFIFATTEVQKIPVTVLSRCQRFDLRRVPVAVLESHYNSILEQEKVKIEPEALQAIAQAADGSVRDGLSLLDQAIALSNQKKITLDIVTAMLGLGDRTKVANVLENLLKGDAPQTITLLDDLHTQGQDPLLLLTDLMTLTDTCTRLKIVPGLSESKALSELEKTQLVPLSQDIPLENWARLYQLLLNALAEAKVADRPMEAVTMAMIRITHLASLPPVTQLLKQFENTEENIENNPTPEVKKTPELTVEANAEAPKWPQTWEHLVEALTEHKPSLGAILSQKARISKFSSSQITFSLDQTTFDTGEVQQNFNKLVKDIFSQTPEISILPEQQASKTVSEDKADRKAKKLKDTAQEDDVAAALAIFPGAEVVDVQEKPDS